MSGMLTEYGTLFQKYLLGEIYVNGWRSEWRIEQERRREEEGILYARHQRPGKASDAKSSGGHRAQSV